MSIRKDVKDQYNDELMPTVNSSQNQVRQVRVESTISRRGTYLCIYMERTVLFCYILSHEETIYTLLYPKYY